MTLVVDASVAIKWVLPEDEQDAAEAILLDEIDRIAPEFLLVEIANVLRTKVMRGQIEQGQARSGFAFVEASVRRFIPDRVLTSRAFEIAIECNHSVYDCMYLACAEQDGGRVVTADMRFINRLRDSAHSHLIRPLTV